MADLFNAALYNPISELLVFIYSRLAFRDLGFSIIILTAVFRLALLPLFHKTIKQQIALQKIQPEVEKLKRNFKDSKEKLGAEILKLYQAHKINPLSLFIVFAVQLPIIIGLYEVINKQAVLFDNFIFLGFINLREKNILVSLFAAVFQYVQGLLSFSGAPAGKKLNRMMAVFGAAITFMVIQNLASAVGLYWGASNVFSILQQVLILKKIEAGKKYA